MSGILDGFTPDPDGGDPPFLQIRKRIAADIAEGSIAVGTKLPSVRALAAQMGVANNTAARVYRELEESGIVETHGRGGTIVTRRGSNTPARVRGAAERLAKEAALAGMDDEAVIALVRASLQVQY